MGGAARIRPARPDDLEAIYEVCLLTGDSGADASHLHRDPKLVGHVFAAPYAVLEPELALVAEDDAGVGGYILGALDTPAFEARLETQWWPALRAQYPDPQGDANTWNLDELRAWQIHHPHPTPRRLTGPYPSHLHIDLVPRFQGRGLGRAMMDRWLALIRERGSSGVHLGVSPANHRARRFYRAYGLAEFRFPKPRADGAVYFVRDLRGA